MMKSLRRCFILLVIGFFCLCLVGPVLAEQQTVKILAPWEGTGQVFRVGPEKLKILGAFEGIMYIETGEGALDAAALTCPAEIDIDVKQGKATARGHSIMTALNGDMVFGEWRCEGVIGAWQGTLTITGGTGVFEGITGSGDMLVRTVLGATSINLESGAAVREAIGLAIWPNLKVTIP
jgi:hypothetical protein